MRRWLPYPLLALLLLGMWLLLVGTASLGHVLLGGAIAAGAARAYARLQPHLGPVRRVGAMVRLAVLVLLDIVRSNVAVGRIVLHPGTRAQTSGFLDIPLELRSPAGLAVLACIVTATPGTAWAGYDAARGVLTLHILDLIDEDAWIRTIKGRYEHRLREIFE